MFINLKDLISLFNLKINGVIHVGAHRGQELENYIKLNCKNIILFEPLKANYEFLLKKIHNTNHHRCKIVTYNTALGNIIGEIEMFLSTNDLESSSILEPMEHKKIFRHVDFLSSKITVKIDRLDSYKNNCNFLNLDTQGYELEVLKGSIDTLKHIDYIYSEVTSQELYRNNVKVADLDLFLNKYGFKRVYTHWDDKYYRMGDAFYVKNFSYSLSYFWKRIYFYFKNLIFNSIPIKIYLLWRFIKKFY